MNKKSQKSSTLIIQPEGIYWISYLENEPSVRWTGKNAGDAIQHYVDTMHPGEETVALKIKRRVKDEMSEV